MATKHFCDACNEEMDDGTAVEYLCHIDDIIDKGMADYVTIENGQMVGISGRTVTADLCRGCYNEVAVAMVRKIRELQEANK